MRVSTGADQPRMTTSHAGSWVPAGDEEGGRSKEWPGATFEAVLDLEEGDDHGDHGEQGEQESQRRVEGRVLSWKGFALVVGPEEFAVGHDHWSSSS